MVRQHYQLNAQEFEKTLGESEGQGSLASCSPWGQKESDTTQRLHNNTYKIVHGKEVGKAGIYYVLFESVL